MMYKSNLEMVEASIAAQEELNRIAHKKAVERKMAMEEDRKRRMAELEEKKKAQPAAA